MEFLPGPDPDLFALQSEQTLLQLMESLSEPDADVFLPPLFQLMEGLPGPRPVTPFLSLPAQPLDYTSASAIPGPSQPAHVPSQAEPQPSTSAAAYGTGMEQVRTLQKFFCGHCGKGFARKYVLKVHVLTHTEEKPYQCKTCGQRFTQRSHLTPHERTHAGEKPYVCDFCGIGFVQSSVLTLHERIHTGEKPYACDFCGKSFAQRGPLTIHERTHTGEKPYDCSICNIRFADLGNMRRHQRRFHPGG
jgi:uncharacterized Zn-finger protein